MTLTFGRVPHPRYQDRLIITRPEGDGWDDLGKRTPKGVTWHRMEGNLVGTDQWFRMVGSGNGLVDYGIGVGPIDGGTRAGVIYRWCDPRGTMTPWASGPYQHAWGDGRSFVEKYGKTSGIGSSVLNRDRVSIEISGQYTTPLDNPSRDAIAGLTAYYADQYQIPWDKFPIHPNDGFSFICWHNEFNGDKACPGDVVKGETDDLIERTRAILKQHQTSSGPAATTAPPPAYASPDPIVGAPVTKLVNGKLFISHTERRRATKEAPLLQYADPTSKLVGPPIQVNQFVDIQYICVGQDNQLWYVLIGGARTPANAYV